MKTAIITGGNRGLGFECALALVKTPGWRVVIACRDPQGAEPEIKRLRRVSDQPTVEGMALDLASLASVNAFAGQVIASSQDPIQALICNAGIQVVSETKYTNAQELWEASAQLVGLTSAL